MSEQYGQITGGFSNTQKLSGDVAPRGQIGGEVTRAAVSYEKDYDILDNHPYLNDKEIIGHKTSADYGLISNIEAVAGEHIGEVGTPSVIAETVGDTTTMTFDYLKGATGDTGARGDTGATGEAGPKGDTGATGERGETGPQGATGEQGETGPKGDTGSQGPKGDTGAQGPKGDTGEVGATGPKGDTGEQGPVGETGPKGDTGAEGPKGETGEQGPNGDTGAKGDTGESGPKGDTGEQGPKGDTGEVGPKGDTGATGEQGPKGDTGEQGPKGKTGPKGDTGEVGPQGEIGPKGDTGEQGPKGDTGAKGDTGEKGDTGAKGATGEQGPKGDTGATGADGAKGDTGPKGDTGAQGPTGATGPKGDTGATGPSVQSDWAQTDTTALDFIKNKQLVTDEIKGTQTLTGNPITITDAAGINAEALKVEFSPKQDLHGYDFPWVGGAGKNKLPLDLAKIKSGNTAGTWSENAYTLYGVTFTVNTDDGGNVTGIKVNGTNTSGVNSFMRLYENLTVTSNMIISGTPNGSGTTYLIEAYASSVPAWYSDASGASGANIPPCTLNSIDITVRGGQTVDFLCKPMICLATAQNPTVFEKWSNICPITGYTEVGVEDTGINQWDEEWETGVISISNGENISGNGIRSKNYCKCQPNTSYYLSVGQSADYVFWYDKNNAFIEHIYADSSKVITSPSNAYYFKVRIDSISTYANNVSINYPSTDTNYHPHQSRTASVTFGQTVYGGSVDFLTGVLTVDKAIVDMGDLAWTYQSSISRFYTNSLDGLMKDAGSSYAFDILCSAYPVSSGNVDKSIGHYGSLVLLWNSDYTDGTALKNSLNGVQLVYKLAAPFTIQLTPQELKLLKGTNHITTNGTTIALDYIPNNSIGDAVKASEEYTDRAVDAVEKLMPQKTVLYDDVVDVGDDFSISIPSSFNYILFELSISSASYYGTGSLMVTSWDDTLNILATSHESELRTCVLLPIRDRVEVYGDFMNEHGELKITAF